MKKYIFLVFLAVIVTLFSSNVVFAYEKNDFDVVSQQEKYYRTTTIYDKNVNEKKKLNNSITQEITEKEYNSFNENNNLKSNISATIETTYKKLTTTILSNGSYFRYKAVLSWKNMPKIRSYDTIAIGHFASVKPRGGLQFSQKYCYSPNNCYTSSSYYPHTFTAGSSATFKVPSGTFTSLTQTFYFDVQKNTNSTIVTQNASGDYAHAVKNVNTTTAQNYTVSNTGIHFDSTVIDNFDDIQVARAIWTGSW